MKKLIATALIGASAIFAASAVSAATLTTFDSNLKMETPNDNWKEISDPDTIITLTDGRDKVTVKEFRKDDEIPMPIISFDDFEEI